MKGRLKNSAGDFQTAFSVGIQITLVDNALWKFCGRHQLCPAQNTADRVRRCGAEIGGVGRYRTWFTSKKLLKHGEFTGSGDVWGDGSGKICFTKWQKVV